MEPLPYLEVEAGLSARERLARVHRCGAAALVAALGVATVGGAGAVSRSGGVSAGSNLFWLGLVLIYLPGLYAVVAWTVRRGERLFGVLLTAVGLMASRIYLYPTAFVYYDELLHGGTLTGIERSHQLFGTPNTLLPVSSAYPGLELATYGISAVTGLDSHGAGVVLLFASRLVLTLALFGLVEYATGNNQAAAGACALYAANPQYLYYNSQYAYESLALPMAVLVVYLLATRDRSSSWAWVPASLVFFAVVTTHHLTALITVAGLAGWWLGARRLPARRDEEKLLSRFAAVGLVTTIGWLFVSGLSVVVYLWGIAKGSIVETSEVITGGQHRQFFADASGDRTPPWQQYLSLGSVGLTMLLLVPAVRAGRRLGRSLPVMRLFAVLALVYPLIPAGHLSAAAGEATDRASGFIYVGLGAAVGWWLLRRRVRAAASWRAFVAIDVGIVVAGLVLFVGGTISGAGPPWLRLPGPYLVSADNRSVDGVSVSAAEWAGRALPARSRVLSDRINAALMGSIGDLTPVITVPRVAAHDPSPLFFDPVMTANDWAILAKSKVEYLVVDRRLATGLPKSGVYFQRGEAGSAQPRTSPISRRALDKLSVLPGARTIFDNGSILIVDVRGVHVRD